MEEIIVQIISNPTHVHILVFVNAFIFNSTFLLNCDVSQLS